MQTLPKIKPQKPRRRANRLLQGLAVLMVAAIGGGAYFVFSLKQWAKTPVLIAEPVEFDFARGTSAQKLAQLLVAKKLVSDATKFSLWLRGFSSYEKFQAGLYRFNNQTSPEQIAEVFMSGKIFEPIALQYTIPEGFTLRQFRDRLVAKGVGSVEEFNTLFRDRKLMQSLKVPGNSFEGFIYPATYTYHKKITAQEAIREGVNTFWENLPKDYQAQLDARAIRMLDAVIIASLIEHETKFDDEKPLVSEVIWKRLKENMHLAIDAALIYGIEDYKGDILWKHLKDSKNPYNTRIHRGLPPTPIGAPNASSLLAVLNPSNYGYYYYVVDRDKNGHHHFSKTLSEHNQFVQKLVRATKRP